MGYMGTGLQPWIYNMRPRGFMSRRRKPDAGDVSGGHEIDLNDLYRVKYNGYNEVRKEEYTPEKKAIIRKKIKEMKEQQRRNDVLSTLVTLIIISIAGYVAIVYFKLL